MKAAKSLRPERHHYARIRPHGATPQQPGETVGLPILWSQVNDSGLHVPVPADYFIVEMIDSHEVPPEGRALMSLRIIVDREEGRRRQDRLRGARARGRELPVEYLADLPADRLPRERLVQEGDAR